MNELENLKEKDWDKNCLVCGKSVGRSEGMAHIKVEGHMIALCCPLCIETFNKDPKHYLSMRFAHEISAQLRHPHPDQLS